MRVWETQEECSKGRGGAKVEAPEEAKDQTVLRASGRISAQCAIWNHWNRIRRQKLTCEWTIRWFVITVYHLHSSHGIRLRSIDVESGLIERQPLPLLSLEFSVDCESSNETRCGTCCLVIERGSFLSNSVPEVSLLCSLVVCLYRFCSRYSQKSPSQYCDRRFLCCHGWFRCISKCMSPFMQIWPTLHSFLACIELSRKALQNWGITTIWPSYSICK